MCHQDLYKLIDYKKFPILLIIFRLFAGLTIVTISIANISNAGVFCTIILALGVLSDIFDGVLARKFNVVTNDLRLWDSRIDVIFWLCTAESLLNSKIVSSCRNLLNHSVFRIKVCKKYMLSFLVRKYLNRNACLIGRPKH